MLPVIVVFMGMLFVMLIGCLMMVLFVVIVVWLGSMFPYMGCGSSLPFSYRRSYYIHEFAETGVFRTG
jgi:hypothetical protein